MSLIKVTNPARSVQLASLSPEEHRPSARTGAYGPARAFGDETWTSASRGERLGWDSGERPVGSTTGPSLGLGCSCSSHCPSAFPCQCGNHLLLCHLL